jgi:hypothetical protein
MNPNEIGTCSGKPSKRARNADSIVDGLVQAIDRGTQTLSTLADPIKEAAVAKTTLPDGLFELLTIFQVLSLSASPSITLIWLLILKLQERS